MSDFLRALHSSKVLVMDGAMGTEIMRRLGCQRLECGEAYNLSQPELIRSIHRAYLDAGADVLLTNTFQAYSPALWRSDYCDRFDEIWQAGIDLARLQHPRTHFVLADVGPVERLTRKIAVEILRPCAAVDGILLETWSSLEDLRKFRDRPLDVPLLVSFTFHRTRDYLTFTGATPERCAQAARQYGAAALGVNCGKEIGLEDMLQIVRRYQGVCDLPLFVKPNAGSPGKSGPGYPRTPEAMAVGLLPLMDAGVRMVGGCCGTTPEHVRAFREVVDEWNSFSARRS